MKASDETLTLEQRACNFDTMRHIEMVRNQLEFFVDQLLQRGRVHDQSKLEKPEVEMFTEFTSKLATSVYGSEEYEGFRKAMGPALDHHYAKNRHHPEHFASVNNRETEQLENDIGVLRNFTDLYPAVHKRLLVRLETDLAVMRSSVNGMNLIDLVELFSDWKAATLRHHTGNLRKSIEHNTKRFGLSEQLSEIFENTADLFDT